MTNFPFSPFAKRLIKSGYVNQDQMWQAIIESTKTGRPLTEVLQSLTGRQLSPELRKLYKKLQLFELKILYRVECLSLEDSQVIEADIETLIDNLIPVDICRRYKLVPLSRNDDINPPSIVVAMKNPDDLQVTDDLKRILRPQGLGLQRMVITEEDYQQLISRYLDEQVAKQKQLDDEKRTDIGSELEDLESLNLEESQDEGEIELNASIKDAEDKPVINLVNKILAKALQEGVSDIHIEPQDEDLRIRFRKDGVLQEVFGHLPKKIIPAVINWMKY